MGEEVQVRMNDNVCFNPHARVQLFSGEITRPSSALVRLHGQRNSS
jgi:hypothetical protein